ncbi:MAG: aspartate aminotransferase family protein [Thermodesulfobacteriota bacterium]
MSAQTISQDIFDRYRKRTPRSSKLTETAKQWMGGGETRRATYYHPYPTFMEKGEGAYLIDCDGNKYLDLLYNYTSVLHGHAHPKINEASRRILETGIVLGSIAESQTRLAEILCNRIPAMERVRFCNCGTEATMFALRTARAFTGKNGILKMDGGYHGGHEFAQINLFPQVDAKGLPVPTAESHIPRGLLEDAYIAPFNDLETVEEILKKNGDKIGAVIVEPCLGAGGQIEAEPGYLARMRELTRKFDVLLIFDEVMQFRHHTGGVQAAQNVEPDLTCLGKIIGGGYPVGAFGGRKEVMSVYDVDHKPSSLFHSGTFSGNNITMAAGITAMELYDESAVERINALGDRLKKGMEDVIVEIGIKGCVTGLGSILNVHFQEDRPRNGKEGMLGGIAAADFLELLHLEMMNRNIYPASRGMIVLSTVMTEEEVDQVIKVFKQTLELLKPFVAEKLPQLV